MTAMKDFLLLFTVEAVVAQLASARLFEREISCSIFSDLNVCFDFPVIRVAIALNTRSTDRGRGVKGAPTLNKVTLPLLHFIVDFARTS